MRVNRHVVRAVRKGAHLTHRATAKAAHFSARVEDKTTRIITGKDLSVQIEQTVPVEKALFDGIRYNIAPLNPALPGVGRTGKVTLLIPSLTKQSFFGGTATALIVAGRLAMKLKKPLRIVETLAPGGKDGLGTFFADNDIHLDEAVELIDVSARTYNRYGYIDLHPDDTFIVSAWWDAKIVQQLPLSSKFVYLIQDYEPIFYPNSDEFVMAESTYHADSFVALCNTELMLKFMASKKYKHITKDGLFFEPAVSKIKAGKSIKKTAGEKKRLFMYGRPSVARNLFYTGLAALNEVFDSGSLNPAEWEIFIAGQDNLPDITLSAGGVVKNLGKMTIPEYDLFVRTVDIAVSPMMAPHPNYPTLELASVGAAVVTTKYETKTDLSIYSANIFVAEPSAHDMAAKIIDAAALSYQQRIANLKTNNILDDWQASLAGPLDAVVKKLQ